MGTAEACFWIAVWLGGVGLVVTIGFLVRQWWRSGRVVDLDAAISPTMLVAKQAKRAAPKNRIIVNDDRAGVRAEKKEREKHDL